MKFSTIKLTVKTQTSPYFPAFHHFFLTPSFQVLSIDTRSEYRNCGRPRLRSRKPHKPPRKPPRNHRLVGRKVLGNRIWKRQMLPQLVPTAPVTNMAVRKIALERRFSSSAGSFINALYRGIANSAMIMAKNLAKAGKDLR